MSGAQETECRRAQGPKDAEDGVPLAIKLPRSEPSAAELRNFFQEMTRCCIYVYSGAIAFLINNRMDKFRAAKAIAYAKELANGPYGNKLADGDWESGWWSSNCSSSSSTSSSWKSHPASQGWVWQGKNQ